MNAMDPRANIHAFPPRTSYAHPAPVGDLGDFSLTLFILVISMLPLICLRAGVGSWGGGSLGLGTAGALLAGRELCLHLAARLRSRD
jgi:hypothetical protein